MNLETQAVFSKQSQTWPWPSNQKVKFGRDSHFKSRKMEANICTSNKLNDT